ncbi:MAG: class I SAM-dependent methyltransferase [Candidatus Hydrogenedentes bacterium]|nr:class I SAM-dependent methyltransferase [Candidatus Hydrogenedentota bacterium]
MTRFLRGVRCGEGRVLLDVGSGGGSTSLLAAGMGFRVISMDLSIPGLRDARLAGARMRPPRMIAPVAGDCCRIPLRGASADAVIASHIIEHLDEPRSLLAEANRVLRPGGVLRVSCPSTFHVLRIGRWLGLRLDPPDHKVTGYSARDVRALLPEGLEVTRWMYEGRFLESNFADLQHGIATILRLRANPARLASAPPSKRRASAAVAALWFLKELILLPLLILCKIEDALLFFMPGSMISLEIRKT